jgi:heterodisulfide reductase subunit B
MPILYITQLIGLTQGLGYAKLGLDGLIVSSRDLLQKRGIIEK